MNTTIHLVTILALLAPVILLSWPAGRWLAWAMQPENPGLVRKRIENAFLAITGLAGREEQSWKRYSLALLMCNAVMFAVCVAFLALQQTLPLNPDAKGALSWHLIFNTAASFVTNTNLQHYSGEVHMSYLSQLCALMWLQFVSCATGLASLAALSRALRGETRIGNFFVDFLRAIFLVLLPAAIVLATLYVLGGMPMTFSGAAVATTLEGATQTIARGPVAAFVAIKQLGTNGGGFFGPNSTHPFENPSFFTNYLSLFAIVILPMASVWMFGRVTRRMNHAACLFGVMLTLLVCKIGWAVYFEDAPTSALSSLAVEHSVGNLEGKELRFGSSSSALWAVLTTSTSNGSVNAMHDSLNPLTGLAAFVGLWLNATFGGVGVGMINMFVYVILAVFISGMMVGRTPEYLARRVESREVALAVIALLSHAFLILVPAAIFAVTPWGLETLNNPGAHGLSEIVYEFSSAAANNGSGFEGLGDNTVAWNVSTGLVMLVGRYLPILLTLAIAGSLATKKPMAKSAGTLPTHNLTFALMLIVTIVFLGALTFFPIAILGPIVDHLSAGVHAAP